MQTLQICSTEQVKAGVDAQTGGVYFSQFLPSALAAGQLSAKDIQNSSARLFSNLLRLGLFDGERRDYADVPPSAVDSSAHRQLAAEMAEQSVVLLENGQGVLPLSPSAAKPLQVAVLGLLANASGVDGAPGGGMLGEYYSPFNTVAKSHTTLLALQRRAGLNVSFAPGFTYCPGGWFCDDDALFDEAVRLSASSEVVVVHTPLTTMRLEMFDQNCS